MGWLDKAKAASKIATEVTRELAAEVDREYGSEKRYAEAKNTLRNYGQAAREMAAEARVVVTETAAEAGKTETGAAIGGATRSLGRAIADMPVLTVVTDSVKARHSLPDLQVQFREDPNDPLRAVWLAEGILRVRRDLKIYTRVRSVTSPTYLLFKQSVQTAAGLGQEETEASERALLRRAWALSRHRLKRNPRDLRALEVMARVYLAQNMPQEALKPAQLAVMRDPSQGLAWVTLARVYLAKGDYDLAEKAAGRAVDNGAGYGHEVAATAFLAALRPGTAADVRTYEAMRRRVTVADRRAYLGAASDGVQVADSIWETQARKFNNLAA